MKTDQKKTFLLSIVMAAAASGIVFSTINNYVYEIYGISAEGRGVLEFFRELPGVLTVLFLAAIVVVREKYIMVVAALLISVSLVGMAFIPSRYWVVVAILFMWSIGAHVNMVLQHSYGVALSAAEGRGRLFGAVGGMRGVGQVVGTGVVWLGMGYAGMGFPGALMAAALFSALAALGYSLLVPRAHTARRRRRLVVKRAYGLFYLLAVLFGFRKQIFLVFAPWVLVRIFSLSASDIAFMMFISAAVGIFVKPALGAAIDRFGERRVLCADSVVLLFVCAGYGLVPHFFTPLIAVPMLYALYIVDDLLFSLRSAHTTYLSKIAHDHDELTSTISMSFAIEHVVSMIGPVLAGIVWMTFGFSWVFAIAGVVAVFMFIAAFKIPSREALLERAAVLSQGDGVRSEVI
jgi:predicted MFS family arabinose efflux permease